MSITAQNDGPRVQYLEFTLGDRLTRSLRHADLGVAEMAEILGVGRETVGRWMHDHNAPKRAALMAWAAITNVELHWLESGCAIAHASDKELRACRDSNPKPSDLYPIGLRGTLAVVKPMLTSNRRTAQGRSRHLRSVS